MLSETELGAQYGGVAAIRGCTGLLLGKLGMREAALRVLEELPKSQDGRTDPYSMAMVHIGLSEPETAVNLFNEAFARHSTWLPLFNALRELDGMLPYAGYLRILREMGLP